VPSQQELAFAIATCARPAAVAHRHVFLTAVAGRHLQPARIVPAIDLRPARPARSVPGDDARIVVVERAPAAPASRPIAARAPHHRREHLEPPAGLSPEVAAILRGIVATPTGTVRVLDLDALLSPERLGALAREESQPA
jgi:chemotaxis signal transduction protein